MIDKEIIIDGVDVSDCEYRDYRNFCRCNNSKPNEGEKRITGIGGCEYNPNCYFKQLKRKEQECEDLNKQVEALNEKISRKKAIIEFADCPHYSYGDNTIEPTCTNNFCYDVKSCDHKNMVKYEKALDEIEQFINIACDACKKFIPSKQSDINCRYCQKTQIEKIINRVKGKKQNEES